VPWAELKIRFATRRSLDVLFPAGSARRVFIRSSKRYADRSSAGPDWQHEIKWDGYRIIARKEGERVRIWARTGTDYTTCLDRIRWAVAALPIASAVLDGEAVAFGDDGCVNFGALRSLEAQAGALMIAYDLLELDGADMPTMSRMPSSTIAPS
jgi:ATP-dependent DNA ligase